MGWAAHRWRLYGLALREAGRAPILWLRHQAGGSRWRASGPERLLFAPQDLRTSDPTVATDLYGGVFAFADAHVDTRGQSPFDVAAPSVGWARTLYGFGWLRHLRAADTALAREHGRSLVADAIGGRRRSLERGVARETRVVARRVISFLCQSPLVLNGAERGFYVLFLRAIGRGVAALERDAVGARDPLDRLIAAIALSYAALCCSGYENRLRRATRLLTAELDRQILPDGGHVSRHPGVVIDLLLDLLPLRLLYASRSLETPEALGRVIDRMMPMLRYLRGHGPELALFNGMGATAIDQVATLLSYDNVRGTPPSYAEASGYLRLAAGGTVLLADTGAAPRPDSAGAAHAGCLSFECSADGAPLVVNAGAPPTRGPARTAARHTAAHSTLGFAEGSSGLFLEEAHGAVARWLEGRIGPVLMAGPADVQVERAQDEDGAATFLARHDGYLDRFGCLHERRWRLAPAGERLDGEDRLVRPEGAGAATADPILRFHLHPSVRPRPNEAEGGYDLLRPNATAWRFRTAWGTASVEDSLYHGGPAGRRATTQIVVRATGAEAGRSTAMRWSFERLPESGYPTPAAGGLPALDPSR